MKKILAFAAALLMLLSASALAANVVQPGADFYYLDTADVLSEQTEGEIFFCNQLLEKAQLQVKKIMTAPDGSPVEEEFGDDI